MIRGETTGTNRKSATSFRWVKILLVVIVALCLVHVVSRVNQIFIMKAEAAELETQLAAVAAELSDKEQQIELLNNDTYIERLARENLGMVRVGEKVVIPMEIDAAAQNES